MYLAQMVLALALLLGGGHGDGDLHRLLRARQHRAADGRGVGCVEPEAEAESFARAHVVTLHLSGGEHVIRALLPKGTGIDTLHLVRRHARDVDYIALLEAEGFRSGVPKQPVTQTEAYRSLSRPLFAEISSHFLSRLASDFQRAPWWVRRDEWRAIAPTLKLQDQ